MAGSLCTSACGHCGRCNAPEDEEPETLEPIENEDDCPTCGAHVNGKWAVIEVVRASMSGPAEWEPRCWSCVGHSRRLRMELADCFGHEE